MLSYSYVFTILLLWKISFWLSSLWCCLGKICPFLMSTDPLLGLRTEMWYGWLWFVSSKGRLKCWFDVCFVNRIWWEHGIFFWKEMFFCFATLCKPFKSSLWKPSEDKGLDVFVLSAVHVVLQAGGMGEGHLQNLRFHKEQTNWATYVSLWFACRRCIS